MINAAYTVPIRLNSLKLLETEVQNPKSGFEAVKCIPPPWGPPVPAGLRELSRFWGRI